MSGNDIVHGLLFIVHAKKIEDLNHYHVRSHYEFPDGGYVLLPQSARTHSVVKKFAKSKVVILTGDRVFPFLYEAIARKSIDVAEILFEPRNTVYTVYTDERTVGRTLQWGRFEIKSLTESPVANRSFTWTTDPDSLEIWRRILAFWADLPLRRDDGGVLLHLAASRNDTPLVELLLTHKADVSARTRDGCTPLHVAADLGHAPAAALLLKNGAGVDERAANGLAPIHAAARKGHAPVCKVLLAHGTDVRAVVRSCSLLRGTTPLHLAIESGNANLVSLLLCNGADANATGYMGSSPLQAAVGRGCPRVCNIILNHGAHVDNPKNKAAFRTALRRGAVEMKPIVERMCGGGHAVTAADARDAALLHGVVRIGCDTLLRQLLELGANANAVACGSSRKTLLHVATERAAVDAVQLLLRDGADPNKECSRGRTPLFYAALEGRLDLAAALIQAGASLTTHDITGETVLSAVCAHDMAEMATLLLQSGADPNDRAPVVGAISLGFEKVVEVLCKFEARGDIQDASKRTALHVAAMLGDTKLLKIFIGTSSDLDVRNAYGWTPLVLGMNGPKEQVLEVAELLLRHGADPNIGSPIVIAARRRYQKVVEVLCQFGAQVDQPQDECTALQIAVREGDVETARVLIRYGADVNAKGKVGLCPLYCAVFRNKLDAVKVLSEFGARLDQQENGPSVLEECAAKGDVQTLKYLLEYNFRDIIPIIKSPSFASAFRSIMNCGQAARGCFLNFVFKMEVADADPNKVHDGEGESDIVSDIIDKYSHIFDDDSYTNPFHSFADRLESKYDAACWEELSKMKETHVGNSPWTLHDVFTKSVHRLSVFARNEEFAKPEESASWFLEKFEFDYLSYHRREIGSKYNRIIGYQHQKGCQRRELIDGALRVSTRLFKDVGLPVEVVEAIFGYLSAQDLLVFQTACSLVPSHQAEDAQSR